MNVELSPKQIEFINNANHRFNFKIGATQCGKTYIDVQYVIPNRILNRSGKVGINLILGVTRETIERNVLEPMRDIWGPSMVSQINSKNWAYLFGNKVYCLGSEKVSQVSKLRGAKFKYVYIDELVDMNEEVFELLKSRMSLEYSVCDATGNPSHPNHFIKRFIDSNADVYSQSWTLYDNPFLPKSYIRNLEIEYAGTVYFDRYILGKWTRAEGVIYKVFANNPERFFIKRKDLPVLRYIQVGVDFGGNGSQHAFTATGITHDWKAYVLRSISIPAKDTDVDWLIGEFVRFAKGVEDDYGPIDYVYCDSAEQTIINTIRNRTQYKIYNSLKNPINDRIRVTSLMMSGGRLFLVQGECDSLVDGFCNAVWDDRSLDKDVRLDNGTTNVDILDSFEYSIEYYMSFLSK